MLLITFKNDGEQHFLFAKKDCLHNRLHDGTIHLLPLESLL
jgi:hypothetical protein